ncbi:hypothetical protein [Mycoplasma sp. ATU-Cv-508]|uniref:hypothetical protein n=1 Tax=Mycoplasma sp. ATU-Cv-508 TaxID=2048001 RepID=UPI000FDE8B6A
MDHKKTLFENFPIKTKIFHHQDDFAIVQKVSDVWMEKDQLVVEMLLSNLQKSYLRIEIWTDEIIRFNYHQKKLT